MAVTQRLLAGEENLGRAGFGQQTLVLAGHKAGRATAPLYGTAGRADHAAIERL
jgi:hypothetical protein